MTPIEWNDSEPGFPDHLPPLQPEEGLTGNRRFRKVSLAWDTGPAKLVLQVEFAVFSKVLGHWKTVWRDAIPEDITPAETVVG
jgi:hypothetical protein